LDFKLVCLVIVTFVSIAFSQPCYAIDSPQQDNYPSFEIDRSISTTALNGQVFNTGFTFSGWFKFNKLTGNQTGVAGYSWNSLLIESLGDNSFTLWVKQKGVSIPNLSLNQWINIAVTISGTHVKWYLDGELLGEQHLDEPSFSFPTEEGNVFGVGNFFGHVKQFKLWDRTLSDEELQQAITSVNSQGLSPLHQWIMDEGQGFNIVNSGTSKGTIFIGSSFYWSNIHSPYTLLHNSKIQLFGDQKPIPEGGTAGTADFDQDGIKEVFFHGTIDAPQPPSTPMLIYKVIDGNRLVDVSDSMIDGGLYNRVFPTGRKTVVTDLNADGYDDIFYVNSSGHNGHIVPEPSSLLLSQGKQGKIFPAHGNIKMPPCTLNGPAFEGQKPCLTSNTAILYPDENAELVDFDIRTYGHGTAMADIDRDGDMDLYSQIYLGGERDDLPISSYFLINDGQGNFVANWQLVPHKVFQYWYENFDPEELGGETKDLMYSFSVMDDFDGDGYVDMALTGSITKAAQLMPPTTPFSVETEYPWRSVYELVAWGNKDGFSEEYSILESNFPDDLADVIKDTHTLPLSIDIDNDGDKDLIVGRINRGYDLEAFYLQVFRNEGGRVFVDKTAELIPQAADYVIATGKKWAHEINPYDFNNDGCMDFLLMAAPVFAARANEFVTEPFRVWINNCDGYFSPARDSFFGKMGTLLPLDIDGDGGLDFVTTTGGHSSRGNTVISYILKQTGQVEIDYFIDTDRDGSLDSDDTDDDGDGVVDVNDAFSKIASETTDTDGDGVGNNTDTDDDEDGVADVSDAFPLNAAESIDTDLDSIGNNADSDDDGDGIPDTYELANELNPLDANDAGLDKDSDGLTNLMEFAFGTDINNADTDEDGIADNIDNNPLMFDEVEATLYSGQLSVLPDMTADGVKELGVLSVNAESSEVSLEVLNGVNQALIKTIVWSDTYADSSISLHVVDDMNDNGVSEVGLFGLRDSANNEGKPQMFVRDLSTGIRVSVLNWPANWRNVSALVLPDMTGDGLPEVGIQGRFKEGSRPQLVVKNGLSNALVDTYSYPNLFIEPMFYAHSDVDGDGVAEISTFGRINRNNKIQVKIASGVDSKDRLKAYNFPDKWTDISWHRLDDMNGDGEDEWGLFGRNREDGRPQLIVKNGTDPKGALAIYAWTADLSSPEFFAIPDMNNDGVDEVAVVGVRSNGRYQFQVKDGADRNVSLANHNLNLRLSNVSFHVLDDLTADGIAEIGFLGINTASSYVLQVQNGNGIDGTVTEYNLGSLWSAKPLLHNIEDVNNDRLDSILFEGIYAGQTKLQIWAIPDTDSDTYPDTADAFPTDENEWLDTDNDSIGNNEDTDDDGDGVSDANDTFPLDSNETLDTDGDGTGNNTDTDDDNDGVIDVNDAFPFDSNETLDTDGDGTGNNTDTDDDGDGVADDIDNCISQKNSDQIDLNNNGIGAICEEQPTVENITVALNEDESIFIVLLGTDIENDNLTYIVEENILPEGENIFEYTPPLNFNGQVSFGYKVSDGESESSSANILIDVIELDDLTTGFTSITGNATVGSILTFESSLEDVDGDIVFINFQWMIDNVDIEGEITDKYIIRHIDVGKTITVKVTFTDSVYSEKTVVSQETSIITIVNAVPEGEVGFSGEARNGGTLTAYNTIRDLDGVGDISYEWFVSNELVASEESYIAKYSDLNKEVFVRANYIDNLEFSEFMDSDIAIIQNSSNIPENIIKVNQLGYLTQHKKLAIVPDLSSEEFVLKDSINGDVVMIGELSASQIWGPTGDEKFKVADFSAVTDVGSYYIEVEGLENSFTFEINDNIYSEIHDKALKAFYYNRASIELTELYAGVYARKLGHKDNDVHIFSAAASDGRPEGTSLSSSKGWYDAGDYGKYVVNSGITTYTLMAAYENFPEFYNGRNINIPESEDNTPDILDEIMWNLEWMLSMQDSNDGGVYHKLTTLNFSGPVMPDKANEQRYFIQKSTAATLDFAAVMSMASRIYEPFEEYFPGKSLAFKEAAISAWNWAEINPDLIYMQNSLVKTGAYADTILSDEFAWAAAELFITTQENKYWLAFKSENVNVVIPSWSNVSGLAYISLINHAQALLDSTEYELIKNSLIDAAQSILSTYQTSSYQVPINRGYFIWGSNSQILNAAWLMMEANKINPQPEYIDAILGAADYIFGRNPTSYSFVTGAGTYSSLNIHHRQSYSDGINTPIPGWLVGGSYTYSWFDGCSSSRGAAKSYLDDWCSYTTNEIAINWNAPLVFILATINNL
jgi:endoglucanase